MSDYTAMGRKYDKHMNRSEGGVSPVVFDPAYVGMQGTQTSTGATETKPVDTGQSLDNIWIQTFIRSVGWKPKAQGFNIDGKTGTAEFSGLLARGQIDASGGMSANIITKLSQYDAHSDDYTILGDASSGAFSVTLPLAGEFPGKIYFIKKIDSTGNAVTVNSDSLIDGGGTQTLSSANQRIQVQSNGIGWYILN